ncbi:hypothetical protein C8J57DRAFT_1236422 [Mycena rebaudengoi]|nr:hypothetical protein C8J57DRAFT_1236422 [Mycena rebaudengoi]
MTGTKYSFEKNYRSSNTRAKAGQTNESSSIDHFINRLYYSQQLQPLIGSSPLQCWCCIAIPVHFVYADTKLGKLPQEYYRGCMDLATKNIVAGAWIQTPAGIFPLIQTPAEIFPLKYYFGLMGLVSGSILTQEYYHGHPLEYYRRCGDPVTGGSILFECAHPTAGRALRALKARDAGATPCFTGILKSEMDLRTASGKRCSTSSGPDKSV